MAVTENPVAGTRVRGEWVHPEDASIWETITGVVVPNREAATAPYPEGAGLTDDDFDFFSMLGAFDDTVTVKIETVERGGIDEDEEGLSSTYAAFDRADVTVLED